MEIPLTTSIRKKLYNLFMMYEEMPLHGERNLPEFNLRQEDLPEMLRWEVGGKYYLVMKVEMTGIEKRNDLMQGNDSSKLEGEFKVMSVRALDEKPVDAKSIEREDFNRMVAKVRSGGY